MAGELEALAVVTAVASLVVAVIAILGYLLNRKQVRESQEQTAVYTKRVEVAEKQLELNKANLKMVEKAVTAVVAIAESQKKQVEAILRQERTGVVALEKAIETLQNRHSEDELRATRETILREREATVKEHRALAEKQRANWTILTGVAKALGWAYDRGLLNGDDGDDED